MNKSYFIFMVLLTVLYILYYTYLIFKDLYGKKKERQDDVEIFEISQDNDEGISVSESETGFRIGAEEHATDYMETAMDVVDGTFTEAESAGNSEAQRLLAATEEKMNDIDSFMSTPFNSKELYAAMLCKGVTDGRPDLEWKTVIDKL